MRRALFLSLLLLSGCLGEEERLAAANAKDDQQCLSYGAKKGSDAYVTCRAQLEASRRQADATRSASSDRPHQCHYTGGGYGGGALLCD